MKNLILVLIAAVVIYLGLVLACTIKHSNQPSENGMDPCGSCWALQFGDK